MRVFGDVRYCLGDDATDGDLDSVGWPPGQSHVDGHRNRGPTSEALQCRSKSARREHGGVDAAGQFAKLVDDLAQLGSDLGEQLRDLCRGRWLLVRSELERQCHQSLLRALRLSDFAMAAATSLVISDSCWRIPRSRPCSSTRRRPERLADLLAGAEVELSEDVLDRIEEIVRPGVYVNPGDLHVDPAPAIADKSLRRR